MREHDDRGARVDPPACAKPSPGQATITASAPGKRSGVAKRGRGSITNGRQPAARASRVSAAASGTAPIAISRGAGSAGSAKLGPRSSAPATHVEILGGLAHISSSTAASCSSEAIELPASSRSVWGTAARMPRVSGS